MDKRSDGSGESKGLLVKESVVSSDVEDVDDEEDYEEEDTDDSTAACGCLLSQRSSSDQELNRIRARSQLLEQKRLQTRSKEIQPINEGKLSVYTHSKTNVAPPQPEKTTVSKTALIHIQSLKEASANRPTAHPQMSTIVEQQKPLNSQSSRPPGTQNSLDKGSVSISSKAPCHLAGKSTFCLPIRFLGGPYIEREHFRRNGKQLHSAYQAACLKAAAPIIRMPQIYRAGACGPEASQAAYKASVDFKHAPFFTNEMTAFMAWLETARDGSEMAAQLPLMLQVLLSQNYRLRALQLICHFLDLGAWAVEHCLIVGIFPYIVRLLHSSVAQVRPHLIFIWAKIIASSDTDFGQHEGIREAGYKYFLACLEAGAGLSPVIRAMTGLALTRLMVRGGPAEQGPDAHYQALFCRLGLIPVALDQLEAASPRLPAADSEQARVRIWLILALARLWHHNDEARWCGVRNGAHEVLFASLRDACPEVRAATVYALATFVKNLSEGEQLNDHACEVDQQVGVQLVQMAALDGSPLVRRELVSAFAGFVHLFEAQFVAIAHQNFTQANRTTAPFNSCPSDLTIEAKPLSPDQSPRLTSGRVQNTRAIAMRKVSTISCTNLYSQMWTVLNRFALDPDSSVATLAQRLMDYVIAKKPSLVPECIHLGLVQASTGGVLQPRLVGPFSAQSEEAASRAIHAPQMPGRRRQLAAMEQLGIETPHDQGKVLSATIRTPFNQSPLADIRTDFFAWSPNWFRQPLLTKYPTALLMQSECELKKADTSSSQPPVLRLVQLRSISSAGRAYWHRIAFSLRSPPLQASDLTSPRSADPVPGCGHSVTRCLGQSQWCLAHNLALRHTLPALQSRPTPRLIKLHPCQASLIVGDSLGLTIWCTLEAKLVARISLAEDSVPDLPHKFHHQARISALEVLNSTSPDSLILGAFEDGCIRVWRDYNAPTLVTAWLGLAEQLDSISGRGVVTQWSAVSSQLSVAGSARLMRVWDLNRESHLLDIHTGSEAGVTCLSRSHDERLLIAGLADGCLRAFDVRASPSERLVFRGKIDSHQVQSVGISSESRLYAVTSAGTVSAWQLAAGNPKVLPTLEGRPLHSASKHTNPRAGSFNFLPLNRVNPTPLNGPSPYNAGGANSIACSDLQVSLPCCLSHMAVTPVSCDPRRLVVNRLSDGTTVGTSQPTANSTPTCITFHPFQPMLAAGMNDGSAVILDFKLP